MYELKLSPAQEEQAAELHRRAVIVDLLEAPITNPDPPAVDGVPYLDRVLQGGITALSVTLTSYHQGGFDHDLHEAMSQISAHLVFLDAFRDRVLLVERADDILRAKQQGKLGLIFAFQSLTPLGSAWKTYLNIFHKLGLRIAQLTYNERNLLGDGALEPENRGLTAQGVQAVGEMNSLGILIDLSHASERTTLDAIEASSDPVIFSHSDARAVTPAARNLSDETIKKTAAKGGVIGLSPHGLMTYVTKGVRPRLEDYLNHVDYVARLVGPDHVAFGSDFFESLPEWFWDHSTSTRYRQSKGAFTRATVLCDGLDRMTKVPNLTRGLVARGYSDEDILKILGGNALRVMRQVWDRKLSPGASP